MNTGHRTVAGFLAMIVVASFICLKSASAEVLNAGEVMRIEFKVDNKFTPVPPDVLRLNFGLISVVSPFTTRIAELYDGDTLLGTAMTSSFGGHVGLLNLDPSNSWKTAEPLEL